MTSVGYNSVKINPYLFKILSILTTAYVHGLQELKYVNYVFKEQMLRVWVEC